MTKDEIKSLMGKAYKKYVCHPRNFVRPFGHPADRRMGVELCPSLNVMRTKDAKRSKDSNG